MKTYYCYIISNPNDRTYNGYTTDLKHRLRQHNGELVGGARSTCGRGPWHFVVVLTSPGWTSISCAMRHEWSIKYPTRKRPRPRQFEGSLGRVASLKYALERMSENGSDVHCFARQEFLPMVELLQTDYPFLITHDIAALGL